MMQNQILQVRLTIIFTGAMMPVILLRREPLQPLLDVFDQSVFRVVHVHRCRDMHRRHQHRPLFHAGLANRLFHLRSDVDKFFPLPRIECEVFGMKLHL